MRKKQSITDSQKIPEAIRPSFFRKSVEPAQEGAQKYVVVPDFIKRKNFLNKSKCDLCENSYEDEDFDCIGNCGHNFCISCLGTYCIYKINTMEGVICPQEGCSESLKSKGSVFERLPQQSKDRFNRNEQWKMTTNDPNLRLCPSQKCDGVMDTSGGVFRCPKCNSQYCKQCQLPSHPGPCDKNFQQNFKDWKRCPGCKVFIEKIQGCNHMVCICKHQFCYVCLKNWEDQHYYCRQEQDQDKKDAWMLEYSRCQQVFIGIGRLFLFPLALVAFFLLFIVLVLICMLIGMFCGPCIIIKECCGTENTCLSCIFCPIFMAVGAVLGLLLGLVIGFISLIQSIYDYFRASFRLMCCPPEKAERQMDRVAPYSAQT